MPSGLPDAPPLNAIFDTLRRLWREQGSEKGEKRYYKDLAAILEEELGTYLSPQRLAEWASGGQGRKPTWEAIYWLMQETGYDVKLTPQGARIQRRQTAEPESPLEAPDA